jgi:hypothetical protein
MHAHFFDEEVTNDLFTSGVEDYRLLETAFRIRILGWNIR